MRISGIRQSEQNFYKKDEDIVTRRGALSISLIGPSPTSVKCRIGGRIGGRKGQGIPAEDQKSVKCNLSASDFTRLSVSQEGQGVFALRFESPGRYRSRISDPPVGCLRMSFRFSAMCS